MSSPNTCTMSTTTSQSDSLIGLGLRAHHLHAPNWIPSVNIVRHAMGTSIPTMVWRMVDRRPHLLEGDNPPSWDQRCDLAAIPWHGVLDHRLHSASVDAERRLPTRSPRSRGDVVLLVVMHAVVWACTYYSTY